jgi:hypothetical protein
MKHYGQDPVLREVSTCHVIVFGFASLMNTVVLLSFFSTLLLVIRLSCACRALSSLAFILLVCFLSVADQHLLDKAKSSNGGSYSHLQVEGVKLVTRLTPFLLVMIPFWGIYNQTSTAFQNQGCQMNLLVGSLEIPVSALNIFDNISILMLVPVFDGYVYPKLKEKGYPLTMLVKMGKNHCFLLLSFLFWLL